MAAAYRTGDYSMQAIADFFGVGRMTVSRAVKRAEAASGGRLGSRKTGPPTQQPFKNRA